jgi:hypothetical protein
MRTQLFTVLCLGVVALCNPVVAHASVNVQAGDWAVLSVGDNAVRYGDGGEFYMRVYAPGSFNPDGSPNNPVLLGGFYEFCDDIAHYFVPGYAYEVTGLNPLSTTAQGSLGAALVAAYWANTSSSLPAVVSTGYVPGHDALLANAFIGGWQNSQVAGAIQDEVWMSAGFPSQFSFTSAIAADLGWSNLGPTSTTVDQIVLYGPNNNYGYGEPGQPQLYIPPFTPNPYTAQVVPEPSTIAIWSLLGGLGTIGWWRRKRAA